MAPEEAAKGIEKDGREIGPAGDEGVGVCYVTPYEV